MIHSVIFDWKQTLYSPERRELNEGAKDLLDYLAGKIIPLYLIGKGGQEMHDEVDRLDVRRYFTEIFFAEGDKNPEDFKKCIDEANPSSSFVIGDRTRGEIEIGNSLGATTIWLQVGKFSQELPESDAQKPMFTVHGLHEAQAILMQSQI